MAIIVKSKYFSRKMKINAKILASVVYWSYFCIYKVTVLIITKK